MTVSPNRQSIGATVLGYPRIGRNRELKRGLESYWAGRLDAADLDRTAESVRLDALDTMNTSGLNSVPVNTFSWYDQMLDTCIMVGAVPDRFTHIVGDHKLAGFDAARYFAMARGTESVAPLEMTKWFDTNYHYLVPEIDARTRFRLDATKPLAEFAEARDRGVNARPVVVGPWTFLALAKSGQATPDLPPLSRLDDLVEVYVGLLEALADAGVEWIQIDEPTLVRDLGPEQTERVGALYARLGALEKRPRILVATYFGAPIEALPVLAASEIEGIAIDLVTGPEVEEVAGIPGLIGKTLVLGAVDGRNVWRNNLGVTALELKDWKGTAADLAVSTSSSLLHVPYDVSVETDLEPDLRNVLAFADQKLLEVVALQGSLVGCDSPLMAEAKVAAAGRDSVSGVHRDDVARRLAAITAADREREPRAERISAQRQHLQLPLLPTTTIGSYPQTRGVRMARADLVGGRISHDDYTERMHQEIRRVIALQEDVGLDVLVHGEPERNDMVQYFAEQLEGYASTRLGWVQSYGSRCVRPPILFGDVHRPEPMTVKWSKYAQELTGKPVKGMLTGPVTMLAWSFVRDDQPLATTADQVALALRDEVTVLEAAGISIIQVDEPALRELLPLRHEDQKAYLEWSVAAFRLATSSVAPHTQVHTHLCYSEFGEIIEAIDKLGADVTSIEAARSDMELLGDIGDRGFRGALGPGVYDIHSPRVPSQEEISDLIAAALRSLPADQLWVNPDCGLKTRGYDEVERALTNMVEAAKSARVDTTG